VPTCSAPREPYQIHNVPTLLSQPNTSTYIPPSTNFRPVHYTPSGAVCCISAYEGLLNGTVVVIMSSRGISSGSNGAAYDFLGNCCYTYSAVAGYAKRYSGFRAKFGWSVLKTSLRVVCIFLRQCVGFSAAVVAWGCAEEGARSSRALIVNHVFIFGAAGAAPCTSPVLFNSAG